MGKLHKIGIAIVIILIIISICFIKYEYYYYEGVRVYTNRGVIENKRHLTKDGYNLGLKWQCVEFVKRFYYEYYNHKMPNSYGHAITFYNPNIKSGNLNKDRNLIQIKNNGINIPSVNDIIVMDLNNYYGHVAIVSKVAEDYIEIVQQNCVLKKQKIKLNNKVLGWLTLKNK
jgi:hypothetical protein